METSQEQIIQQVYDYTAKRLVQDKASTETVKDELIEQGVNEENAQAIIDYVKEQIKDARLKHAKDDMKYGALWCIGGLIVTGATYLLAENGGSYIVTWGAILWGGWQYFRGVIEKNNIEEEYKKKDDETN